MQSQTTAASSFFATAHATSVSADVLPQISLLNQLASIPILPSPSPLPTNPHMDIRLLELLERAVIALERIATHPDLAPTPVKPTTLPPDESETSAHQLLAAQVRVQISRIGFAKDDYAQAKALVTQMFPPKSSLKELTMSELTEYAKQLIEVEMQQRAN